MYKWRFQTKVDLFDLFCADLSANLAHIITKTSRNCKCKRCYLYFLLFQNLLHWNEFTESDFGEVAELPSRRFKSCFNQVLINLQLWIGKLRFEPSEVVQRQSPNSVHSVPCKTFFMRLIKLISQTSMQPQCSAKKLLILT